MIEATEKQEMKDWIDSASYETLLSKWRFARCPDPFLQGVVGEHLKEVMFRKRDALEPGEAARASKSVGFG